MIEHDFDPVSRGSIQRMTERLLSGDMANEEFELFESILLSDPDARLAYIEHVNVHAQLSHLGGAVHALEDEVFSERHRESSGQFGPVAILSTVLACCLMLGVAIYVAATRLATKPGDIVLGYLVSEPSESLPNAPGNKGKSFPIVIGELVTVPDGMSWIQLRSGVTCTLHGPAQARFENSSSVILEEGAFVATVPSQAIGFRVETPHVEVIDLGTTFSVSVQGNGQSEVRVLSGAVSARSKRKLEQSSQPFLVIAGQTVSFFPQTDPIVSKATSESEELLMSFRQLSGIKEVEGAIRLLLTTPASVRAGELTSNSNIHLIQEKPLTVLSQPLAVVPPTPMSYESPGDFEPMTLPVGTRCSSFLLHCDFEEGETPITGTVRFARPIIGIIFTSDGLQQSDDDFALEAMEYPTEEDVFNRKRTRGSIATFAGFAEPKDRLTIHEDQRGVTVTLRAPRENIDQIRILVEAPHY